MSSYKIHTFFALEKTINSLTLNWTISEHAKPRNVEFILELYDFIDDDWKIIFWGKKTTHKITDLSPATKYTFQVKIKYDKSESDSKQLTEKTLGYSPTLIYLNRALSENKLHVLKHVLYQRPSLMDAETQHGETLLINAIFQNNLTAVELLIKLKCNIDQKQLITQQTPVMIALYHGRHAIAQRLIAENRAVLRAKDVNGLTPLHYAVCANDLQSVKICLANDCDVDVEDGYGWTAHDRGAHMQCDQSVLARLKSNNESSV